MIRTLKLGIEKICLNIIEAIYENSTANVTPNGEKPNAFPLTSGARHGCLLSPLLFNKVLEVLASGIGCALSHRKTSVCLCLRVSAAIGGSLGHSEPCVSACLCVCVCWYNLSTESQ